MNAVMAHRPTARHARGPLSHPGRTRIFRSKERAVINAPIDEVIVELTQTAFPFDETPHPDLSLTDPAYTRTDIVLGQKVRVRYTFYAVPGGTQVDAQIEGSSNRPADPVLIRAVRTAGRHVEGELADARDRLE